MHYAEENAKATLMAGFTTIQSLGDPVDGPLRDAINKAKRWAADSYFAAPD